MDFDTFVYTRRVRGALYRAVRLRELDAPRLIVRNEQMFLWAMRRMRATGTMCAPVDVPGWDANHLKFVAIHETVGEA